MNKNVFEIYLTSPYVRGEEWLRFIYKISKINGIFRPWNLWICFEKSYIKYYKKPGASWRSGKLECGNFQKQRGICKNYAS